MCKNTITPQDISPLFCTTWVHNELSCWSAVLLNIRHHAWCSSNQFLTSFTSKRPSTLKVRHVNYIRIKVGGHKADGRDFTWHIEAREWFCPWNYLTYILLEQDIEAWSHTNSFDAQIIPRYTPQVKWRLTNSQHLLILLSGQLCDWIEVACFRRILLTFVAVEINQFQSVCLDQSALRSSDLYGVNMVSESI